MNGNWGSLLYYRKFPKYSDTQKISSDHSKIWTMWLYNRVMSPNDADGMANSVDPDQTAQQRHSILWYKGPDAWNSGKREQKTVLENREHKKSKFLFLRTGEQCDSFHGNK